MPKPPDSDLLDAPKTIKKGPNNKHKPSKDCPTDQHFVKTHPLKTPPSKKHPQGQVASRLEHCANNPGTHKNLLSFEEINEISKMYFCNLNNLPKPYKKYKHGDDFDKEIAGWVNYWNAIFKPKQSLDPNLVKALISSESSFNKDQVTPTHNTKLGSARGLMQLTDETRMIIGDQKGELKNYHVKLSEAEVLEPSANICAGIRWIFRKYITATYRLHRDPTWEEVVAEYKGVLNGIIENKNPDPQGVMPKFIRRYNEILGVQTQ